MSRWKPEDPLAGGGWTPEGWWDDGVVLVSKLYPWEAEPDSCSAAYSFSAGLELVVIYSDPINDVCASSRGFSVSLEYKDTKPKVNITMQQDRSFTVTLRETVIRFAVDDSTSHNKSFAIALVQNAIRPEFNPVMLQNRSFVCTLEIE